MNPADERLPAPVGARTAGPRGAARAERLARSFALVLAALPGRLSRSVVSIRQQDANAGHAVVALDRTAPLFAVFSFGTGRRISAMAGVPPLVIGSTRRCAPVPRNAPFAPFLMYRRIRPRGRRSARPLPARFGAFKLARLPSVSTIGRHVAACSCRRRSRCRSSGYGPCRRSSRPWVRRWPSCAG